MRPPRIPAQLTHDPFRGTEAARRGLLTARQLDGRSWRRLFPDVYVHRDVPVTHQLRAHAAALLLPAAVVTGRSAAELWGVTLPPSAHPRRIRGLQVRRSEVRSSDVLRRLGVPLTSTEATAVRLAAILPREDAVVAVIS